MSFFKDLKDNFLKLLIKFDNGFLCDTCRYNSPRDCNQVERPNAKVCKEYSHK
jgi:hypothetical protein